MEFPTYIITHLLQVQKALEIVAAASAKKESTHVAKKKTAQSNDVSNKTSSSNTLQGVPQSLLERVRIVITNIMLLVFVFMMADHLYKKQGHHCISTYVCPNNYF